MQKPSPKNKQISIEQAQKQATRKSSKKNPQLHKSTKKTSPNSWENRKVGNTATQFCSAVNCTSATSYNYGAIITFFTIVNNK